MKTKIPPPVQALIFIIIFWGVDKLAPSAAFDVPGKMAIAVLVAGIGFFIAAAGIFAFGKVGTTTNPLDPAKATSLVGNGIYRFSRNPMYLGLLLLLVGWALWLGNILNVPGLGLFIWYITVFQIKPEEEALKKIFGADYDAYCRKTPRWFLFF